MTVDEVAALPFLLEKGPLQPLRFLRLQQTVIAASGKEIQIEHVEMLW